MKFFFFQSPYQHLESREAPEGRLTKFLPLVPSYIPPVESRPFKISIRLELPLFLPAPCSLSLVGTQEECSLHEDQVSRSYRASFSDPRDTDPRIFLPLHTTSKRFSPDNLPPPLFISPVWITVQLPDIYLTGRGQMFRVSRNFYHNGPKGTSSQAEEKEFSHNFNSTRGEKIVISLHVDSGRLIRV